MADTQVAQKLETTPRASELIPTVLALLKSSARQFSKREIEATIRSKVREMGYLDRAPALGYALTYLKRVGLRREPPARMVVCKPERARCKPQ